MSDNSVIKFLDLASINKRYHDKFRESFSEFLQSPWLILSDKVNQFENQFAEYIGVKNCIGTGNGLDSLELVLESWNIGEGDEVIVPANTYIATLLAITRLKAKPVPVEPNIATFNIDPSLIREKITEKTKAILVVHLYGLPCDMNPIRQIATEFSLKILEDAFQCNEYPAILKVVHCDTDQYSELKYWDQRNGIYIGDCQG